MHAYDTGYYAASHGEEPVPYDESFYEEDWMTDENVNAYNAACEEGYLMGCEEGLGKPAEDEKEEEYPEMLNLYHVSSFSRVRF